MLQEIQALFEKAVEDRVAAAVAEYASAHPDKTEEEINEFRANVNRKIRLSAVTTKLLDSKNMRKERKKIIDGIIAPSGFWIKKFTFYDMPAIPSKEEIEKKLQGNTVADLSEAFAAIAKVYKAAANGIAAFVAVKYECNGGRYDLVTTFTFQNPADEYDELIAKEVLAERIAKNQVLRVRASEKDIFCGVSPRRVNDLAKIFRNEFLLESR